MKLSEWARANGVSRQSATGWFRAGVLPVPARELATGTILVDGPEREAGGVAVYAGLSSADQRGDLDRRVALLVTHLTTNGVAPSKVVSEVGSGLNGHRAGLLGLLRDASVGTIVVEHRDRLARFGVEYLEAALAAQGRRLVVVDEAQVDDVVADMVEVLSGFCARLDGRREALRRAAELALAAAAKAAA